MERPTLTLEPREISGKKVKNLRKQGLVPASICGKGVQSENFQLDAKEFGIVYRRVGRSGLIDINLPSGTRSALVRQVQQNPVNSQFLHVDFRVVDLRTEITADVPIVIVGENVLVERNQAALNQSLSTLHVKGLPTELPQAVEVDASTLEDFNTVIHVSDLKLPDGIEVLTPAEDAVVTLTPSTTAAEKEELQEVVETEPEAGVEIEPTAERLAPEEEGE
jgi:large subunit ribosomal protein L25